MKKIGATRANSTAVTPDWFDQRSLRMAILCDWKRNTYGLSSIPLSHGVTNKSLIESGRAALRLSLGVTDLQEEVNVRQPTAVAARASSPPAKAP